jgi:UDP-3-O-[3-hydroxymyristoyl] glucosamine N-acyltransferase
VKIQQEYFAFSWYGAEKDSSYISKSKAGVILYERNAGSCASKGEQLLVFTDNPRLAFVRNLEHPVFSATPAYNSLRQHHKRDA